jgi:ABC-type cobalt transport system substrate-binding protein
MSGQWSVVVSQQRRNRVWIIAVVIYAIFCLSPAFSHQQAAYGGESEKWPGIDESVIKKIAKERGREAREPLINTDQGDLLLFVFLIAGTIGGFIAGYSWRKLTEDGARKKQGAKTDGTLL